MTGADRNGDRPGDEPSMFEPSIPPGSPAALRHAAGGSASGQVGSGWAGSGEREVGSVGPDDDPRLRAPEDDAPETRSLRRIDRPAGPRAQALWTDGAQPEPGPGGQAGYEARPSSLSDAGRGVVAPSRFDPVVRVASQLVGGPAGSRLATTRRGVWQAASLLILLAVVMSGVGVVQKQHCRSAGWTTPDQFWHACYSDIPVLYGSTGLGGDDRLGLREAVGRGSLGPPVNTVVMWTASGLVDGGNPKSGARRFFDVSVLVLGAALMTTVALVVIASGRRRWDAAQVALAPVLVTTALINYDLLGIALMTAALVLWSRRHAGMAGLMLGLAAGAKPLTAVVAVAVFAVALRAGRVGRFGVLAVTGVVTWLGIRLLLFPGWGAGLSSSWQSFKAAMPGYGSVWLIPQLVRQSKPEGARFWYTGPELSASAATTASLLGLLVVVVATVALALVPAHRPRLALLALFAVAASLVVAKSVPVQATLILLPLLALAGLRWRDHLLWAAAEIAYFVGTWLYIAGISKPDRGLPAGFYLVLLLLRVAAIAWLAFQAMRKSLDVERDPVRAPEDDGPGRDDPLGGPVEDAPDALVVRLT